MITLKQFGLAIVVLTVTCVDAFGAGPPPLDRPSPPACCADGLCYPNRATWGLYETRWRRWPTEQLEPTPADTQPSGWTRPEIPGFERRPVKMKNRPRRRQLARPKKLAKRKKRTPGSKPAADDAAVWNAAGHRHSTSSTIAAG